MQSAKQISERDTDKEGGKICMLPTTVGGHTNIDVLPERFEAITEEPLGEFEQMLVRTEGRDRHGDYGHFA
jgi:hypothetical protein